MLMITILSWTVKQMDVLPASMAQVKQAAHHVLQTRIHRLLPPRLQSALATLATLPKVTHRCVAHVLLVNFSLCKGADRASLVRMKALTNTQKVRVAQLARPAQRLTFAAEAAHYARRR